MTEYIVRVRKVDPELRILIGAVLTYAYRAPLWPGDKVMCPSTPYSDPFVAEVTALGRGDYDGPLKRVLCRVAPDRTRRYAGISP